MKNILTILILLFTLNACNQGPTAKNDLGYINEDIPITERMEGIPIPPPPSGEMIQSTVTESMEVKIKDDIKDQNSNEIQKKIIKDGRIGIEVLDLEVTKTKINTLVKTNGGFYANDRFDDSKYESTFSLKIRIPSSKFENFISELESYKGTVKYKEINARDVTSEFIDLETRLSNKRKYLNRYGELLKKANTVKDILLIENEVRQLEEEIESTVGRLKYLNDLVGYSTLDLVLTKKKDFKYDPKVQDSFIERLKQSFSNGWNSFVDFILLIFRLWPFWLILPVLIYFIRKYRRKIKK